MTEITYEKREKISVRVSEDGHVLLEDIFPNQDISKIESYDLKVMRDGTLIIRFYDKNNILLKDLGNVR